VSIDFEVRDTVVVVTTGEIDHHTIGEFQAELTDGLRRYEEVPHPAPGRCPTSLVVDLSQVTFLDSSGIRVLIEADLAAMRHGGRVVVAGASGVVHRVLDVTGVLGRMQPPAEATRW
jgi:anti-anti-sigma factor